MSYYRDLLTQEDRVRRAARLAFETRKKAAIYDTPDGLDVAEYDPSRAAQVLEVFRPGWEPPPRRDDSCFSMGAFPLRQNTPEPEPKAKRPSTRFIPLTPAARR